MRSFRAVARAAAAPRGARCASDIGTTPDRRLRSLKEKIDAQGYVRAIECHSGLCGLIAEHARGKGGERFDATWSSSLTSSTAKAKPDIETVDTTARLGICEDVLEVTQLPMIYDGDTGGQPEIFHFTVRSLERLGVSMCIIEDKEGLKQNSLFGTERKQQLADITAFQEKIAAGKRAQVTKDFMIIARLEALIAKYPSAKEAQAEALKRAEAFLEAGADGVMIHSKEKNPDEIVEFLRAYAKLPNRKMAVAVPTTYNSMTEKELHAEGVSVVIHANQLIRAAYPAMMNVAEGILSAGRSKEVDEQIMSVKKIISFIPDGTGK